MSQYFFDDLSCRPNRNSRLFVIGREAAEQFDPWLIGGIVPRPDIVGVAKAAACHAAFVALHVHPPPAGTVIVLSQPELLEQLLAAVLLEYRLRHPEDARLEGVPTAINWLMVSHSQGAHTMQEKISARQTLAERLQVLRSYLFDAGECETARLA